MEYSDLKSCHLIVPLLLASDVTSPHYHTLSDFYRPYF